MDEADFPVVGAIGIAGPVKDNTVEAVNIPGWIKTDGNDICRQLKEKNPNFVSFTLLNDFLAAGFGISALKKGDVTPLNDAAKNYEDKQQKTVKCVIGPGTGLGQGLLVRAADGKLLEPFPSEGGHVDFTVNTQEDWELFNFALKYIAESDNIENQKVKRVTDRLCVEALCAGPGVPLMYEFMK